MPVIGAARAHTSLVVLLVCLTFRVPAAGGDEDALGQHFATAEICAICHSNSARATAMRDAAGRPVAPYDLWHASMMEDATADPFWRAVVSVEVAATPARRSDIEKKCVRCHAPMASVVAERDGLSLALTPLLSGHGQLSRLAADGVSCTACHQIEAADRLPELVDEAVREIPRGAHGTAR